MLSHMGVYKSVGGFASLLSHPLPWYILHLKAIFPPISSQKIREPSFPGDHPVPLSNPWLSTDTVIPLEDEVKH